MALIIVAILLPVVLGAWAAIALIRFALTVIAALFVAASALAVFLAPRRSLPR